MIDVVEKKILQGDRITTEDALMLYREAELSQLSYLADLVRERAVGDIVTFNRNFHVEPTNICIKNCAFCSYRRVEGEDGAWLKSIEEVVDIVKDSKRSATEVHITGGVYPDQGLQYYIDLVKGVKSVKPDLHVKAFSAVEIYAVCQHDNITVKECLTELKRAGLNSIPGGGAEIFDETVRSQISPDKASSTEWLHVHEEAHNLGLQTNATMLYGLIEGYEHRVDHLNRLRTLQDKTGGFNCFIPLKFKRYNNRFSHVEECSVTEDLRNYAISRIFLDNFKHIKAYWPMVGAKVAQLSLAFGVDDLDGTVDDSTKIYSMAGGVEKPSMSVDELKDLIISADRTPAERDSLYNVLQKW